jgi:hypothetical protein
VKNRLPEVCYWCGVSLGDNVKEREHVPPLGFFPKGYRENLMTVPACKEHNSAFSALDEEFQLYIKSVAESHISVADFKDRTVRSLERKEARGFVEKLRANTFYANIDGERTPIVRVDGPSLVRFFEKVTRGLYFYHNERPAAGIVQGVSRLFPTPGFDLVSFSQNMLKEFNGWKGSNAAVVARGDYHNPQIFSYDFINLPEHNFFLVVMYFYETVQVIGWVVPSNWESILEGKTQPGNAGKF